ncbi:helix-turn-helix domain-containing protein, partial [Lysinibacillus sp. NPDC098008]
MLIKTLRLDRNLSLRELADKAGVTASYISKIENGLKPNIT